MDDKCSSTADSTNTNHKTATKASNLAQKGEDEVTGFPEMTRDGTKRLLRQKSRQLIQRAGLPMSDCDDIEQAFAMALLKAYRAYDAALGDWLPYAERTLQHASQNLLRERFAGKRDHRRAISLHVTVRVGPDEGYSELAELITKDDLEKRTGSHERDHREEVDLKLDVDGFIDGLPPDLRDLAYERKHYTELEISRRTGVPRSTVYGQMSRIRQHAENVDLDKYLR